MCEEEGIDAQFHKGGILTLARGEHRLPVLRSAFDAYARLGSAQQYRLCSAGEAQERVHVTKISGALYASENASVQLGTPRLRFGAGFRRSEAAWYTSAPR